MHRSTGLFDRFGSNCPLHSSTGMRGAADAARNKQPGEESHPYPQATNRLACRVPLLSKPDAGNCAIPCVTPWGTLGRSPRGRWARPRGDVSAIAQGDPAEAPRAPRGHQYRRHPSGPPYLRLRVRAHVIRSCVACSVGGSHRPAPAILNSRVAGIRAWWSCASCFTLARKHLVIGLIINAKYAFDFIAELIEAV
jgi:hypothetical protein